MASVTLQEVRKVYENGFVAVHGATFDIADGEFVVLVGPSGCGKSTTLRMVAGLETITAGTLRIGERVVNDLPSSQRDIAMVFQNYALYPHMSVYDNLAFALKLRREAKAEIDRRVREAADILDIGGILDRKPRQLSGGQRQRVAVGRAIVRHPQVFLFDEPLSNLDAKLRVQTRKEIARLHRQLRATMVYVTHDQVEAMTMADRIVVMNAGHVQQIGAPLELYENPANRFVAGFIGSPAMNFLPGVLEDRAGVVHAVVLEGGLAVPLPAAALASLDGSRDVVLGIRPEDIRLDGSAGASAARAADAAELDVVVDAVEPLGSEVFMYARAGEHEIVARLGPERLPRPEATERVVLDAGRLHLFSGTGGRAVSGMRQERSR
jgi:multiple sugar transport system ATP-binding protein